MQWYALLVSRVLKYLDLPSEFKISEILGVGKLSVTERSLTWRESKSQRVSPLFLVTGTKGEDQGDELGSITSFFNHKSSCARKLSLRFGGTGLIFWLTGQALGIDSILNVITTDAVNLANSVDWKPSQIFFSRRDACDMVHPELGPQASSATLRVLCR